MRFFISHSAQTERAKAVLEQVRTRLNSKSDSVFVDADILAGDLWRSVLYHELAMCTAAVILLDRTSLDARWVQREVDILLWRQAFDESLVIIPVLIDAIPVGAVRATRFAEFTERQFLLADGLEPEEIGKRVADRFASLGQPADPGATTMVAWFDNIEIVLGRIGNRQKLRLAALELGVTPQDADQVLLHGGFRFLAHQFLGRPNNDASVDAVNHVLYCADAETLRKLARLITPTWVDHSAALPLKLRGPGSGQVAVLNAVDFRTAEHYIQRANCMDERVLVEQIPGVTGEESESELLAQCNQAIRRLFFAEPPFDKVPEDVLRDGPPRPSYLIVNTSGLPRTAVAAVIEELRDRYRWLSIILIVGDEVPPQGTLGLRDAVVLEPPLVAGEERKAQMTVRELHQMIDKVFGRTPT